MTARVNDNPAVDLRLRIVVTTHSHACNDIAVSQRLEGRARHANLRARHNGTLSEKLINPANVDYACHWLRIVECHAIVRRQEPAAMHHMKEMIGDAQR